MTNHYKVLGLPNYSNWADVRKAYITQIKKYHPDVNSTQEAVDICKQLNIAKEALETAAKKSTYDASLKWHLSYGQTRSSTSTSARTRTYTSPPVTRTERRQARSRRNMARNKESWMKEYEMWLKRYPLSLRYTLLGLLAFAFLVLTYRAMFRDSPGVWVTMSMIFLFMYHQIVAWMTSVYYNNLYFQIRKGLLKLQKSDVDRATSKFYNSIFFGGLVLVIVIKLLSRL